LRKEFKIAGLDSQFNVRLVEAYKTSAENIETFLDELKPDISKKTLKKLQNTAGPVVISTLLSLISKDLFQASVDRLESDKYTKYFSSWDHLMTMIYASLSGGTSLADAVSTASGDLGSLYILKILGSLLFNKGYLTKNNFGLTIFKTNGAKAPFFKNQ
jgi:hypothetical protein